MSQLMVKFKSNNVTRNHLTFSQNVVLGLMVILSSIGEVLVLVLTKSELAAVVLLSVCTIMIFIFGVHSEYENNNVN
jgi:hypothetical protein